MSQNDFLCLLEQTFEWNTFVIVIAEERSINKIYEKIKHKQGTLDGWYFDFSVGFYFDNYKPICNRKNVSFVNLLFYLEL